MKKTIVIAVSALALLPVGCASCMEGDAYGRPWSGRPDPPETRPDVTRERPSGESPPY